ncbi:MAG: hypothetical protein J5826_10705 [Bacteroidales bacterium]|nr:hypothetical protein [Bacteroidales bacterium]
MTTFALNNLWNYIQGLTLARSDREWLAGKLMEPSADEIETKSQQEFVKDSLYRALDEVKEAKRGGKQLMTEEEFFERLKADGIA